MTGLFTREINVLNWLHRLWIFCYFLVPAGNADGFPRSRRRTPGSERRLPVNVLWASPLGKLGVDFGTRRQTLPTNPAFFFPLFKCVGSGSCWRSEGKEVKENGGKKWGGDSPRAGGRYYMHVHWSTRFVASCLRIFFLRSQDYPQSQGRERQSVIWFCQCKSILLGKRETDAVSSALFLTLLFPQTFIRSRSASPASPYAPHPPHLHPGLPLLPFVPREQHLDDLCFSTSSFVTAKVRWGADHPLLLWFDGDVAKVTEQHLHSHACQKPERSRALETPPGQLLHSVCGETA